MLPQADSAFEDPVKLFATWLEATDRAGAAEPKSMVLASVDGHGRPMTRAVSLVRWDTDGLLFTTFHSSRKGADFRARPWAAATFYWRETHQQVNVSGEVVRAAQAEADALFAGRPAAAQAVIVASRQSAPLDDEGQLAQRAQAALASGAMVRPADWGGYRLVPDRVEFWQGRPDRLHRRLEYRRADSRWTQHRLQP